MKKLFVALFVATPLVACTTETIIIKKVPAPEETGEETPGTPPDGTQPTPNDPAKPGPTTTPLSEDACVDGQDLDAADIDVSRCPAVPEIPNSVNVGGTKVSLGAWELGTTADGATYVYGDLSAPGTNPRVLNYEGGSSPVNKENLECWAKGYYRLRKILQNPPAEWVALKNAGFQYRFFQFQTDLRNGPTGFKKISSFQDHLVKWVTLIDAQGKCEQPTLTKFRDYAKAELSRRGLPAPTN